jgi:hypothetical protein
VIVYYSYIFYLANLCVNLFNYYYLTIILLVECYREDGNVELPLILKKLGVILFSYREHDNIYYILLLLKFISLCYAYVHLIS